jgi:hypothetical protein
MPSKDHGGPQQREFEASLCVLDEEKNIFRQIGVPLPQPRDEARRKRMIVGRIQEPQPRWRHVECEERIAIEPERAGQASSHKPPDEVHHPSHAVELLTVEEHFFRAGGIDFRVGSHHQRFECVEP